MSSSIGELTRVAVVNPERCKPKQCKQECRKRCPVVAMGRMCIEVEIASKTAYTSEQLCNGCGICGKKCWAPDTELLMFDGTSKKASEIVVGDILMGEDSTRRFVLPGTIHRGNTAEDEEVWRFNDGEHGIHAAIKDGHHARGPRRGPLEPTDQFECKYVGCNYVANSPQGRNAHEKTAKHTVPCPRPTMFKITSMNGGKQTVSVTTDHILVLRVNRSPSSVTKRKMEGLNNPFYFDRVIVNAKNIICYETVSFSSADVAEEALTRERQQHQVLEWEGTVAQYLEFPVKVKKACQMFQPKIVHFAPPVKSLASRLRDAIDRPPTEVELLSAAWVIGLWLADGLSDRGAIAQIGECHHNPIHSHTQVIRRILETAQKLDQHHHFEAAAMDVDAEANEPDFVSHMKRDVERLMPELKNIASTHLAYRGELKSNDGLGSSFYRIKTGKPLWSVIQSYGLKNNKHFPPELLRESEMVRKAVLAGFIDGDGHRTDHMLGAYSQHRKFMNELVHLCRGLGFSTGNITERNLVNETTGVAYQGFSILIGGKDLVQLPLVLDYKKVPPNPGAAWDNLCDGFTLEDAGHGDYIGFKVSGNGRILLGDFTVTHNCPFQAIDIIRLPKELDKETTHRYGANTFKLHRLPMPRLGQVLGLLGANGCGKSTALMVLAGNLKPNLGQLDAPPDWPAIQAHFRGTELQTFFTRSLQPDFKAVVKPQYVDGLLKTCNESTLVVGALIAQNDTLGIRERVCEQLSLTHLLDRKISALSGGELQRVAIAATCVQKATMYVIDEFSSFFGCARTPLCGASRSPVRHTRHICCVRRARLVRAGPRLGPHLSFLRQAQRIRRRHGAFHDARRHQHLLVGLLADRKLALPRPRPHVQGGGPDRRGAKNGGDCSRCTTQRPARCFVGGLFTGTRRRRLSSRDRSRRGARVRGDCAGGPQRSR